MCTSSLCEMHLPLACETHLPLGCHSTSSLCEIHLPLAWNISSISLAYTFHLYNIRYLDSRRLYCSTPETWFGGEFSVKWFGFRPESQSYRPKVGVTAKSRRYSRADPQNPNRIGQKRNPNRVQVLLQKTPLKALLNPPKTYASYLEVWGCDLTTQPQTPPPANPTDPLTRVKFGPTFGRFGWFSTVFGRFWSKMAKIGSKSASLRGVAHRDWPCGGGGVWLEVRSQLWGYFGKWPRKGILAGISQPSTRLPEYPTPPPSISPQENDPQKT